MHAEDRSETSIFSSTAEEAWEEPRAINWLAVAALVLGILSFGAVFLPLMWLLPVAGSIVALAALISLQRDTENRQLGRCPAWIGLTLSLIFLAWGGSHQLARQHLMARQSQDMGQRWLQMVLEGQMLEAYQLRLHPSERRGSAAEVASAYARDQESRYGFEEFTREDLLVELRDLGPDAMVRAVGAEGYERRRSRFEGHIDTITQRYLVQGERQGSPESLVVRLVLSRTRERDVPEASWRVVQFERESGRHT